MDLSTIEGLKLSEEQKTQIEALAKADIEAETLGLKAKNNELITEKRTAAEKALEAKAIADKALADADIEKARKANDLSALEESLKTQFETEKNSITSQFETLQNSVKSSKKDSILSELAQQFNAPEAAKLVLNNMIDIDLSEGKTQAIFKGFDGTPVATDSKTFLDWAGSNESLAGMMKPIDSAGGGGQGNKGGDSSGAANGQNNQVEILYGNTK